MGIFDRDEPKVFNLGIDEHTKHDFIEMARWTKFLAILGFIIMGVVFVCGIFLSVVLSKTPDVANEANPIAVLGPAGIAFILLFAIGMYIYPTYALYKFSTGVRLSLESENQPLFSTSIKYLKNGFKYIGILTIIFIALEAVQIIFVVANLGQLTGHN